jgi:hypothetical protein
VNSKRAISADRKAPPSSERERSQARTGRRRQVGPTGQREGEGEKARVRRRRRWLAGGVHLSGDAGARAARHCYSKEREREKVERERKGDTLIW